MPFSQAIITKSGKKSLKPYQKQHSKLMNFVSLVNLAREADSNSEGKVKKLKYVLDAYKGLVWRVKRKRKPERVVYVHQENDPDAFMVCFFERGKEATGRQEYQQIIAKSDITRFSGLEELRHSEDNEDFDCYVKKLIYLR